MTRRLLAVVATALTATACLGSPPSPPSLAYGGAQASELVYDVADTTVVDVDVMGQAMQLAARATATWDVALEPNGAGVDVSMSVRSLAGALSQPMGATVRVDEAAVSGPLSFSLDRTGGVTVTNRPSVSMEASAIVSGLDLAHSFFPRLPGRAALIGEEWVDTLRWSGEEGPGRRSETSVISYRVIGDTVVDGTALLVISMEGTSTSSADLDVSGMTASQRSDLDIEGHVLWDYRRGTMFEQVRRGSGVGSVSVPMVPNPLPIRVRTIRRARLQDGS